MRAGSEREPNLVLLNGPNGRQAICIVTACMSSFLAGSVWMLSSQAAYKGTSKALGCLYTLQSSFWLAELGADKHMRLWAQVNPHEEWLPPFGPVDGLRMRFLPAEPPVQNREAAVEAAPSDKELSGAGTGLAVGTTI